MNDNSGKLDTIYKYTQELLKEYESSLNRLDTKIAGFIGFSGVLIRLALDLPTDSEIKSVLRGFICGLSALTVLISTFGLVAKPSGVVADPKNLMDRFFNKPQEWHQAYIINGWVDTLDEYKHVARKKIKTLSRAILSFVGAIVLFGIAVAIA